MTDLRTDQEAALQSLDSLASDDVACVWLVLAIMSPCPGVMT
jgi:hypothetical protein